MSKTLTSMALASAVMFASAASAAVVTNKQKYVSHLFGSNTMDVKATYQKCLMDGVACKQFSMVVDGAQPNLSQAIYVNGRNVGVLHTDSLGHGKVKYRTASFIGASQSTAISPTFPQVKSGGIVRLGHMAGVFFDSIDDQDSQEFEVEGQLSGSVGTSGDVSYKEESEDGFVDREFDLNFSGAQPNEALDITVNGAVVYSVTADANGEVHLTLKSADDDESGDDLQCDDGQGEDDQGDDDGGNAVTIPDTFPSIVAGDVVGIDGATATMAASDDNDDDQGGVGGDDGNDDDQGGTTGDDGDDDSGDNQADDN